MPLSGWFRPVQLFFSALQSDLSYTVLVCLQEAEFSQEEKSIKNHLSPKKTEKRNSKRNLHLREEILTSIKGILRPGEEGEIIGWESLSLDISEEYFLL